LADAGYARLGRPADQPGSSPPAKGVTFAGEQIACDGGPFGRPADQLGSSPPAKGVTFAGEKIACDDAPSAGQPID
jgi:hypothetical protein